MMKRIVLLLCAAAFLAGCGSSNNSSTRVASVPTVLPQARTPDEWAKRVVDRFLRPLNRDLRIVNGLNNPTVLVYLTNQNPTTVRIARTRLADLAQCTNKLVAIGPPPPGRPALARVNTSFRKACTNYVRLASTLQKATLFLTSGRSDVIARGQKILRSANAPGNAAARDYVAGIKVAQRLPEFRRAGLRPSI